MELGREGFPAVDRAETVEDQENRVALLKEELNTVLELNAALEDRVKLLREELDIKTQLHATQALDNAPQKLSFKDRLRRSRVAPVVGALAAVGTLFVAAGTMNNRAEEGPAKLRGSVPELVIGEKPGSDSNTRKVENDHRVNIGNAETINQAKRNADVNTKEEFDWLVNDIQKHPGKYEDLKVTSRNLAGGSFLYGGKFSVKEAIKKNQWRELSAFAMGIANDQAIARSAANMAEGKPCEAERNDSFSEQRDKGLRYLDRLKSARLVVLEDGIINTFRSGGNVYSQKEDEAMVAIELTANTSANGKFVDRKGYIKQGGGESGNDCDNCLVITPETDITTPPETQPPETKPPETKPPETQPPETQPPETKPPETQPPETQPPETKPPETIPPETKPPETIPPKHDDGILPGDPNVPADQDPGTPDVPGEGPAGQIPDDTGYVPGENVPPAPTPPETTAPEPAPTPTPTPPETVPAPPAPEPPAGGGTPTNPTGPSLPN